LNITPAGRVGARDLAIILAGTLFVLPVIIGYSFYAYRVFGGKASDLCYD
jgi:cytochrome d ubiquinol oxidase subunit II